MKLTSALVVPLIPTLSSAAALGRRQNQQGDGPQGGADATQGDLSGRPPPRFPFPRVEFPVAKETVVLNQTMYIYPGQTFDGQMKRYERVEGSCNEQAEGTDADAVFNLMSGATIKNVIIGQHQSEGIHALGDAWVENGKSDHIKNSHCNANTCFSLVGRRVRRCLDLQGSQHPAPGYRWWSSQCSGQGMQARYLCPIIYPLTHFRSSKTTLSVESSTSPVSTLRPSAPSTNPAVTA